MSEVYCVLYNRQLKIIRNCEERGKWLVKININKLILVLNILNMVYTLRFFLFKMQFVS